MWTGQQTLHVSDHPSQIWQRTLLLMRLIRRPPSLCWSFSTIATIHASSTEWPGKQARRNPHPAASPEPCRYQPALQISHAAAPVHPRSTQVRNSKHHARLQTDKARHAVPALLTTPSPHDLQALAPGPKIGPKSIHSVTLHWSTSWLKLGPNQYSASLSTGRQAGSIRQWHLTSSGQVATCLVGEVPRAAAQASASPCDPAQPHAQFRDAQSSAPQTKHGSQVPP